jgi:hypothetical protein
MMALVLLRNLVISVLLGSLACTGSFAALPNRQEAAAKRTLTPTSAGSRISRSLRCWSNCRSASDPSGGSLGRGRQTSAST